MRPLLLLMCVVLLAACSPGETPPIEDFRKLGELRVATRNDAIAYFRGSDGAQAGFEHDLVVALANELEVPVRFVEYPDAAQAIDAVLRGQVHLAAAGLSRRDLLPVVWSAPLREVDYVLAGRTQSAAVPNEAALAGRRVSVRRGSLVAQRIAEIAQHHKDLKLHVLDAFADQALLGQLADGQLDLVATDRAHFALAAQINPDLEVKFDLPLRSAVSWAMPMRAAGDLPQAVESFLGEARRQGLVDRLADRYFSHTRRISAQDAEGFLRRVEERLPRFRSLFEAAEAESGIDWRYLAALAYQESQWDPLARSYTGVRGMMMLTTETADHLGVKDRLDARESIMAGARYLASLRDSLPAEIGEPDRTWFATAAYNLGMGHMNGARSLARSLGKDDTSWWHMKSVLPLLARPEYAARLKSGRARGGEAVIMTDNIRNYHGMLVRITPDYRMRGAKARSALALPED